MMSSALLAGGLYPWSRRLLLSRLIGVLVPRLAFQWLYGWINGRDAFALWALAVTLACTLPVDIVLLALLAYVAEEGSRSQRHIANR